MTVARQLAAMLVADFGVREHRDGTSDTRTNGSLLQSSPRRNRPRGFCKTPQGALFGLTLSSRWS